MEYFHLPLPYGKPGQAEPARLAGQLRNFLWQNGLYGSGDIVTALPCQDLFIRTLSFPFRDSAKLEQVVPFEVENLIPMALDDVAMGIRKRRSIFDWTASNCRNCWLCWLRSSKRRTTCRFTTFKSNPNTTIPSISTLPSASCHTLKLELQCGMVKKTVQLGRSE